MEKVLITARRAEKLLESYQQSYPQNYSLQVELSTKLSTGVCVARSSGRTKRPNSRNSPKKSDGGENKSGCSTLNRKRPGQTNRPPAVTPTPNCLCPTLLPCSRRGATSSRKYAFSPASCARRAKKQPRPAKLAGKRSLLSAEISNFASKPLFQPPRRSRKRRPPQSRKPRSSTRNGAP